jgi:hypothetical protein
VSVNLTARQVISGGASEGAATADLTINLDDGEVTGTVTLDGIEASGVAVGRGFAGQVSDALIELEEDSATEWSLPANTSFTASDLDLATTGGIHLRVVTTDHPDGALRGQVLLDGIEVLMAALSGKNGVPEVKSDASGIAGVTVNSTSGDVVVHVQTDGLDEAVAGHVHRGFAGRAGGVVVDLEQDPGNSSHWQSVGDAMLDATAIDDLRAGGLYLNLHTPVHPAGEIRGQILPDNLSSIALGLAGSRAAPPVITAASASGGVTYDPATGDVDVHVTAVGLDDATAAHVHAGFAGSSGGIALELEQDPDDVGHWLTPAGTLLDATQLEQLAAGQLYINVHTPANPAGEVRGQIAPDGIEILHVSLSGDEEVPPVATAATATGGLTLNRATGELEVHVTGMGLDDAAAAHVHQAFAGGNGGVELELEQDPNDVAHWFSSSNTVLDAAQLEALGAGSLYLNVHTPSNPAGEVRGQIAPDNIAVMRLAMTGMQAVPPVVSDGSAMAAVTLNDATAGIFVNINTSGLDDAAAAHLHSGLAGTTGPIEVELQQDASDFERWVTAADVALDESQMASLASGGLYLNLHTPANPGGEVRGQLVPDDIEVVFTSLTSGDVVPPSGFDASGIAATTINDGLRTVDVNVNLVGLDTASGVGLYQAPLGQVGPLRFGLDQDMNAIERWSLAGQALDENAYAALRSQGFYAQATAPGFPNGAIRGQIEPAMSAPGPSSAFTVAAISPANGAMLESLSEVMITFNRAPLASSVDEDQFELLGSGGDASFADGNETSVAIEGISVDAQAITLDFSSQALEEDTYQVSVVGEAGQGLVDTAGTVLDGDNDGNPGGTFISTFVLGSAPPAAPTFSEVQTQIFDVSCAVSGCHSGGAPAAGMNLSAGLAYENIVNVVSEQDEMFYRIEPGEPDNSYLIQKVEGTASSGARMPFGQPALSNELIQLLRDWVADGAADN